MASIQNPHTPAAAAPLQRLAHSLGRAAALWLPRGLRPSPAPSPHADDSATALLDQARCGFHALDEDGRVVRVNHTELALLARPAHEVVGHPFHEFLTPEAAERFEEIRRQHARSDGPQEAELDLLRPDGEPQPVLVKSCPLRRAERRAGSRAVVLDFSEHRREKQALEALTRLDPLTELGNRRDFFERAARAFTRSRLQGEPLALMILDIDHFKRVNDERGHMVGDDVLRHFGRVCRQSLRADDIAGRLGGEEFAVLMPGTDEATALLAAERIRLAVEASAAPCSEGESIAYTVSVGITSLAPGATGVRDLLRNADLALYEAKRGGRNQARVG